MSACTGFSNSEHVNNNYINIDTKIIGMIIITIMMILIIIITQNNYHHGS